MREVRHEVTAQDAVGDEDRLVVGRQYLCMEETYSTYRPVDTLSRDEVPYAKGLGDHDDHTTGHIL